MPYRENRYLESRTRLLLYSLMWTGVFGIAWNLLKPDGWLYRIIDIVVLNQPISFYYLGVGALGLLAVKVWLDRIVPQALHNLLTASCAFAGTFIILRLLLRI